MHHILVNDNQKLRFWQEFIPDEMTLISGIYIDHERLKSNTLYACSHLYAWPVEQNQYVSSASYIDKMIVIYGVAYKGVKTGKRPLNVKLDFMNRYLYLAKNPKNLSDVQCLENRGRWLLIRTNVSSKTKWTPPQFNFENWFDYMIIETNLLPIEEWNYT
jgi:hypothetical protein